jgi:hypothetical protein
MKKLILAGTTAITALLLLAFVAPAAASGIIHSIAPGLHLEAAGVLAGNSTSSSQAPQNGTRSTGSSGSVLSFSPNNASRALGDKVVSHSVSTPSQQNCGRFGDGFHGGKHLFVCPNRPFPPPANH